MSLLSKCPFKSILRLALSGSLGAVVAPGVSADPDSGSRHCSGRSISSFNRSGCAKAV